MEIIPQLCYQSPSFMLLYRSALPRIPEFALIEDEHLHQAEALLDSGDDYQEVLDRQFQDFDRLQPTLALWISEQLATTQDEMVQSVGYFLAITIHSVFHDTFVSRVRSIGTDGLDHVTALIEVDESFRIENDEPFDTDEVLAMGQPNLLSFVAHHLDDAIEQSTEGLNMEELEVIYRALLVEILALSMHVDAPPGVVKDLPS